MLGRLWSPFHIRTAKFVLKAGTRCSVPVSRCRDLKCGSKFARSALGVVCVIFAHVDVTLRGRSTPRRRQNKARSRLHRQPHSWRTEPEIIERTPGSRTKEKHGGEGLGSGCRCRRARQLALATLLRAVATRTVRVESRACRTAIGWKEWRTLHSPSQGALFGCIMRLEGAGRRVALGLKMALLSVLVAGWGNSGKDSEDKNRIPKALS